MGLLDRVKQNQTVPPGGAGNGPATATLPGATPYTPQDKLVGAAGESAGPVAVSTLSGGDGAPARSRALVDGTSVRRGSTVRGISTTFVALSGAEARSLDRSDCASRRQDLANPPLLPA